MSNQFSISTQPHQSVKTVRRVYKIIRIFFGPGNKHCLYCNQKGEISILPNSFDVLKAFPLSNEKSYLLIKLLQHASAQTFKFAGGGSTVTALLTCKLLISALRFLSADYNVIQISKGLNQISFFLQNQLLELSLPISTNFQIQSLIKTNIGQKLSIDTLNAVSEALYNLKRDGLILVDETTVSTTKTELINGIELDSGFASSYFVNDIKNFEVFYNNPYLLILDKPLYSTHQIKKVIDFIQKQNAPLIIIVETISDEVLSKLILNAIKKKFKITVVKHKSITFVKTGILEDIALLATNIFPINKDEPDILPLGQLKQAIIRKNKSTFIFSKFTKILAHRRINELNRELLFAENDYERDLIKARIARLSSNTIKIQVRSPESYKTQDERQKIQATIKNLNGALEEGCVPGGGQIYLYLKEELKNWGYTNLIGEEIYSMQIASEALIVPFFQLAKNTCNNYQFVINQIKNSEYPFIYNFLEKKVMNAYEGGIIDSTKQIRLSLENSFKLSSIILTCG